MNYGRNLYMHQPKQYDVYLRKGLSQQQKEHAYFLMCMVYRDQFNLRHTISQISLDRLIKMDYIRTYEEITVVY